VTPEEARAAFPVLERLAYLNAGSFGPLARSTVEAMQERARRDLEQGRGGPPFHDELNRLRDEARARLAGVLSVPPDHVALTTSTTRSCAIVAAGLGLGPGDEVVTTDVEHFGLVGALHASGARVQVARVRDRPAAEALETLLAEVGPRTRLVALSHVSWTTGHVLPVAELREALEIPMLVDGAQSAGAIPVDASRFDFYTVSGQKWLCGPDTTGALYVADPDALAVASPSYLAQEEYEPGGTFTPKPGAARFDSDWLSLPSLAGLLAAIDAAPDWRFEAGAAAARRCRELMLEAGVEVVTEPDHATLVTFRVDGDAAEAARAAYDEDVVVRDLPGLPWIRASCGYWTNDEDLERLVSVITQ
jgi:L-cysteine/cystine lyase